jgi:hypothetical protein
MEPVTSAPFLQKSTLGVTKRIWEIMGKHWEGRKWQFWLAKTIHQLGSECKITSMGRIYEKHTAKTDTKNMKLLSKG